MPMLKTRKSGRLCYQSGTRPENRKIGQDYQPGIRPTNRKSGPKIWPQNSKIAKSGPSHQSPGIHWVPILEEYIEEAQLSNNVGTKIAILSGTYGDNFSESGFSNTSMLDQKVLKQDYERVAILRAKKNKLNRMNFHIFDMKHFKNKKEKDLLRSLEVFNPDAIVMAWTHSLQGDVHQLLDGNEPGLLITFDEDPTQPIVEFGTKEDDEDNDIVEVGTKSTKKGTQKQKSGTKFDEIDDYIEEEDSEDGEILEVITKTSSKDRKRRRINQSILEFDSWSKLEPECDITEDYTKPEKGANGEKLEPKCDITEDDTKPKKGANGLKLEPKCDITEDDTKPETANGERRQG